MLLQPTPTAEAAVVWEVPQGCPSEAVLRDEVRRLLGGAEPDFSTVQARARIEPEDDGFALTLTVTSPDGSSERRLSAPTCAPLVESAALYLAMAVDPVATVAGPEPEPEPAPEPVPEPAPALAVDLRVRGGAVLGMHAEPGGVGLVSGSLRWGVVRLELGVAAAGWDALSLAQGGPAASLYTLGGEFRACPSLRRGVIEVAGCLGTHLALHRARGVGVDRSSVARRLGVDAVVGAGLAWWPASRVGLWLEPDMVVGVYRPRFVVEGAAGDVTADAVGARVTFGITVRLWEAGDG